MLKASRLVAVAAAALAAPSPAPAAPFAAASAIPGDLRGLVFRRRQQRRDIGHTRTQPQPSPSHPQRRP